MDKKSKQVIKQFQCDHIRMLEETFAQTLSESDDVRLFFINENRAFTDGRNIIIDPALFGLFADSNALIKTGNFLNWPHNILSSEWNALQIITRAQNIHECLHILYTDFPCRSFSDSKCDTRNKRKVMSLISNIIEDAYIEAVGCSVYDNMDFYLKFMRVSQLFISNKSKEVETVLLKDLLNSRPELVPEKEEKPRTDVDRLNDYLGEMIDYTLYPWAWNDAVISDDIRTYVNETKQLFDEGCVAESPAERYKYSSNIFDVIEHLIPDDDVELDIIHVTNKLYGYKTHTEDNSAVGAEQHEGRSQAVKTRLFVDLERKAKKDTASAKQLASAVETFTANKNAVNVIESDEGYYIAFTGSNYDCSVLHKNIKINECRPKIESNLKKAYQNIYKKYSSSIRSYNNKFEQILKARVTTREEKYTFGSGITSSRLGDPQKRYWYRTIEGTDTPDMAVLLLVDGSGSMYGSRNHSAINSALILHEVLKSQEIEHAIVEHRAHFDDPEIDVNILIGFDQRPNEKLNIMQMDAYGDNRDGLALFWAEKYIEKMTQKDYRLIIVISDGVPAHSADGYFPPVSVKDTANAVKKITRRGTNIIAISLDDEDSFECYTMLSEIYPNLIACNDLSRLPGQLLGVIAKLLS